MKKTTIIKAVVAACVIGPALGYFGYQVVVSNISYYYSVDEFVKQDISMQVSVDFRLAGVVKPGTIERDIEKMQLKFVLAGNESELPISYKGVVPDNFSEDKEVLVDGRLDAAGVFAADTVITRCESKYKAKLE